MSAFPLRKMLGVLFLGFIVYRILLFGGAEFINQLSPNKINGAILDNSSLYFKSDDYFSFAETALKQNNFKLAEFLLLQSLSRDNSNGRSMALAIDVYGKLEEKGRQSTAVYLTPKLWNSHLFSRSKLASYWAEEKNETHLLSEWSILMLQDKKLEASIFPLIQDVYLERVKTREGLLPYLLNPPLWWNRFFSFVSKNASNLDSIKWIYENRQLSSVSLKKVEYRSYIKRLTADNQWGLAFQVWNDQIKDEKSGYESFIYDGGFENIDTTSKRTSVFDWKISPAKGVKFGSRLAFGADKKALKIDFSAIKEKRNFKHVSQVLMLSGNAQYKVSFKVRTGGVKAKSDLLWKAYCVGGNRFSIGESVAIIKSPKWTESSFIINVPAVNCSRQLIRLESTSNKNNKLGGRFWFDDIKIEKG